MKTQIYSNSTAGFKGFTHAIVIPLGILILLAIFDITRQWSVVGAITYVLFACFIYGVKRNYNHMDESASVFFTFALVYPALLGIFLFVVIVGAVA